MEQYDTYKDSGIEWIGEIPSHWNDVRIKHLAIGNDTLFLDGDWIESKEIVFDENNIRYITTGNIGEGKYKEQGNGYITEETFEKLNCTEVFPGDLLISRLNPPIGRACIIPDLGKRIVTSVDNVILRPNKKYSKNFLCHFFSNAKYYEYTLLEGRGATMQRISRGILGNIKIVTPSQEEQTSIANYLDRKTAEIDALIADKKRLLELYEEEKTTIINQAVTKGIDPNAKMKDSGIEWLGEIPEHWEAVSLKWVSKIYSGGTPSKNNEDFWQNGTIPWLNSGTVNQFYITEPSEFITEDALNNSSAKWIPENSLVIALAGQGKTKGMAAQVMFKSTCNQSMGVIVPNNDLIENRFLLYYLVRNYQNIRNLGGGDKRDGINLEMVGGIPIPLLPIKEQQSIVRHIENEYILIDAKIAKTQKLIVLLTEYRTVLISELVTGKIKVMD